MQNTKVKDKVESGKNTVLIGIVVLLIIIGVTSLLLITNLGTSLINKTNDNIVQNGTIDGVIDPKDKTVTENNNNRLV